MPLRRRLEVIPETIQGFELAADEKYFEGLELLASGHSGGGIYSMGFAAEMLLKNAYFRFAGACPADLVEPRLGPARTLGRCLIPEVRDEHYHSVQFWALLLIAARHDQSRSLPPTIERTTRLRAERLHENWWVAMRYRRDQATSLDVGEVYEDVTWLRDNYVSLWS